MKRPAKQLCGFGKRFIKTGATAHFSVDVSLSELFSWNTAAGGRVYVEGVYTVEVGLNSRDCAK